MKLRILGCSGGIGAGLRTTSMLIDDDILIDAGSGIGDLSLDEMMRIRHIFLTHSHLDHIAFIPLLLDSVFDRINEPVVVHGLPETLQALKEHIFNWVVWPDFAELPSTERPVLRYATMTPDQPCSLDGRQLEMISVEHAVPAVGYRLESANGKVLAFSGDCTSNDTFWYALNSGPRLDVLIVEAAFPNKYLELSRLARHYCPSLLAEDMGKLSHDPDVYITHNKPGDEETIIAECRTAMPQRRIQPLRGNQVFEL